MGFQREKSFQEEKLENLYEENSKRRNSSVEVFKIENFLMWLSKKESFPKNFEEKIFFQEDCIKTKLFKKNSRKRNFSIEVFQKRSTKEILEKETFLKEKISKEKILIKF